MVQTIWHEIPDHYLGIEIDAFVVMPNHVHGIVMITGRVRETGTGGLSLPEVVQRYKALTTKRYVDGVKQNGWLPFPGRLWQRNYWERVIRDETELHNVREYICGNPDRWEQDELHPGR